MCRVKQKWRKISFWLLPFLGLVDLFLQWFCERYGLGTVNKGVSFGLGQGIHPGLILVGWCILVWWFWKGTRRLGLEMMLIGGGVNLFSRYFMGGVHDYLSIQLVQIYFNISDVLIVLGVVSYILGI